MRKFFKSQKQLFSHIKHRNLPYPILYILYKVPNMKSRAIVLHTLKYNDTQIIANVLTEEMGCVGMIVRISRDRKSVV